MDEAPLILRPVRHTDEHVVRASHQSLAADVFEFAVGWAPGTSWSAYVDLLDQLRLGQTGAGPWVPATLLLAEVAGTVVGRTSIRHELNEYLLAFGGHIGDAVLPEHRRRGHATEILRQSLVIARSHDVIRVLVTCDDDNEASARVIVRNGGTLEDVVRDPANGQRKRRYWIG